jgi:hypothetical protein
MVWRVIGWSAGTPTTDRNIETNSRGEFSTKLIPAAINTTHYYEINVADSIRGNKLAGEIEKLKLDYDTIYQIHFSNYTTSNMKRGLNKKFGQLITMFQDGRPDTSNFVIQFTSK